MAGHSEITRYLYNTRTRPLTHRDTGEYINMPESKVHNAPKSKSKIGKADFRMKL